MRGTKKSRNKHQHKLIVLISTLNYMNFKLKKYTQSDILYYFNNNMKRNGQKPTKLKTLQSYLYKLEKEFKVTMNYYRHLGVNMGTEIYYKLKYSKKECYRIINKLFREKKEEKFQTRVKADIKKTCIKNGSVEKWECYYNTYNNKKEEKKDIKEIEKLQIEKYAKKCNFRSNAFYSILNLKLEKDATIEVLKVLKRTENFIEKTKHKKKSNIKPKENKLASKRLELNRILDETRINLENEGYNSKQLETQIQRVYEQYQNKPHFIIENNKYNDLEKIIGKLKKSVERVKATTKEDEKDIRSNVFSILLEQLRNKVDIKVLVPILKEYLNKQNKLEYSKVFSNHYYYELLELMEDNKDYLKSGEPKKNTS
ncbi:plasmid maintenance protein (plasmid) [Borrelia hermsii]|uniref:plasmid maintenance protein n=1 Tax=Borrelia hermsii TaxID=140 RepID=UPI0034624ED5